ANYQVGATSLVLSALKLSPSTITAYGSTVVSIDVLAGATKYTDQQLTVNFTSTCVSSGRATMAVSAPTNNGTAQVVFRDQGCGSNDAISASVVGVKQSASATLSIGVPAATSIQFSTASPTDKSLVIKGQGGISRTETATLTFTVFDIFNNPLPGQLVTFSTTSPNVTINKLSDSTDQSGQVITTVNSGSVPTTFRIVATLASGVSTSSDSIVVTTGQVVKTAFSLSVTKANVEGLNYDSGPVTPASVVSVLLADQNGNPVADGTPVVFQTNLGAVGSANKGGCNTVNGGCSVDFRTQNPRVAVPGLPATPCNNLAAGGSADSTRTGLATICASTTDGVNTVFGKTTIFFSGGVAGKVYLDGGSTALSTTTATTLSTVGSAESKVFTVQVNDVNDNPMPVGTTVTVASLANATLVDVLPASVPNIFPHNATLDDPTGTNVTGPQGSTHRVTLKSTAPTPCTGPTNATFSLVVTTPLAQQTIYPFKLAFSCP
ncbi:MAG: Ig-like domain-containing protein, partial [Massilia sp.]